MNPPRIPVRHTKLPHGKAWHSIYRVVVTQSGRADFLDSGFITQSSPSNVIYTTELLGNEVQWIDLLLLYSDA